MPKEVPETTNIDHFGGISSHFEILELFRKDNFMMIFDSARKWFQNGRKMVPQNSAETSDSKLGKLSRGQGGGSRGGKPPLGLGGLGGSDRSEDRKKRREIYTQTQWVSVQSTIQYNTIPFVRPVEFVCNPFIQHK